MVVLVEPGKPPKRRISNEARPHETHAGEEEPDQLQPTRWQVPLLRALIKGNVEDFAIEASAHPEAIHLKFTRVSASIGSYMLMAIES